VGRGSQTRPRFVGRIRFRSNQITACRTSGPSWRPSWCTCLLCTDGRRRSTRGSSTRTVRNRAPTRSRSLPGTSRSSRCNPRPEPRCRWSSTGSSPVPDPRSSKTRRCHNPSAARDRSPPSTARCRAGRTRATRSAGRRLRSLRHRCRSCGRPAARRSARTWRRPGNHRQSNRHPRGPFQPARTRSPCRRLSCTRCIARRCRSPSTGACMPVQGICRRPRHWGRTRGSTPGGPGRGTGWSRCRGVRRSRAYCRRGRRPGLRHSRPPTRCRTYHPVACRRLDDKRGHCWRHRGCTSRLGHTRCRPGSGAVGSGVGRCAVGGIGRRNVGSVVLRSVGNRTVRAARVVGCVRASVLGGGIRVDCGIGSSSPGWRAVVGTQPKSSLLVLRRRSSSPGWRAVVGTAREQQDSRKDQEPS